MGIFQLIELTGAVVYNDCDRRCISSSSVLQATPSTPKSPQSSDVVNKTSDEKALVKPKAVSFAKSEIELTKRAELERQEMMTNALIDQSDIPLDVTKMSGVPEEHITERRVRIFQPAKNDAVRNKRYTQVGYGV